MYELEAVTQVYPRDHELVPVLRGLFLRVPAGQFVTILGERGTGKSTLVRILAGLERPVSGTVLLGHEELAAMSAKRLTQVWTQELGVITDPPNLRPHLTVAQSVELPLARLGVSAPGRRVAVAIALARTETSALAEARVADLDREGRQRVAVAAALAAGQRVLVVDAPTYAVTTILRRIWAEQRVTLVVATRHRQIANRGERSLLLAGGILHEVRQVVRAA